VLDEKTRMARINTMRNRETKKKKKKKKKKKTADIVYGTKS